MVENMRENQKELAKKIILEIVHASEGSFNGATRLYKAFLLSHLYYFKDSTKILSNWPIVHMPNGHGIDDGNTLIKELVSEGKLEVSYTYDGPFKEALYTLKGDWRSDLPLDAVSAIERTIKFINGKSGSTLSKIIHDHSPSYNQGVSGEELHIYIDALPDDEYIEEENRISAISKSIMKVFQD